ncbi:glycosyltransferase family 39 protein [Roseibium aggregatum]|uniref:Glycosyltransferase family 39 protein n=1 Tax=Roseibium aggregatum TaxID=187304 RepID=A0A939EEC8_9HYPH|nr:glycosyltransferase family 39 protein [Roseibium aggregatum]MBN9671672.1 glycosyltransferase family 39 protein [Roseibium aggregatum]
MRQSRLNRLSRPDAGPLILLLILAVSALLRIRDLDRTSLWYDEAVSWSQSSGTFGDLLSSVAADNYPPLHNIILWLIMPVFGDSESALRFPSALLGVLAVWLLFRAGTILNGRSTGLLAAALLAVSPFHIWYSTEARMYALLAACGLAFLLCVLKVLEKPSPLWLTGLAAAGTLFLYSHIYALFGFAAVGLVCAAFAIGDLFRTGSLRGSRALNACLAMAVSAFAFLPWLIVLADRARSVAQTDFWIAFPDTAFLNALAFGLAGSLTLFWILLALAAAGVLFCLFGSAGTSGQSRILKRLIAVCCAYTFGPATLAYLYSVLVQPILFDRYLIAAWPGLLLLAAAGAQKLAPKYGPVTVFAATLALTYPELEFTLFQKIRPEWREIVADYKQHMSPGDRLTLYKGFAAPALAYYLREPANFDAVENIDELRRMKPSDGDWLLVVHCSRRETDEAVAAFGEDEEATVSQRFGWGASGLKLMHWKTAR